MASPAGTCRLRHRTAPHIPNGSGGISITHAGQPSPAATDPHRRALLQAAFRDLHGARLHGYCLLLSLGDRFSAARAAAGAIAEAIPRLAELRHPERAAAWLRAAATRSLLGAGRAREPEAERRETLRAMGVTDVTFDGLAGLRPRERAAFVAAAIERLEPIDVEAVLRTDAAGACRLVKRARRRYVALATARAEREPQTRGGDAPPGGLTARIEAVAERALGASWGSI